MRPLGPVERRYWVSAGISALIGAAAWLTLERGALLLIPFTALVFTGVLAGLIDAASHRLPDVLNLALAVNSLLAVGLSLAATGSFAVASLWATVAVGTIYLPISLFGPGLMGLGDTKYALATAPWLGLLGSLTVVVAHAMAFVLAGLVAVGLILSGRATAKSHLALGPYLVAGTVAASLLIR